MIVRYYHGFACPLRQSVLLICKKIFWLFPLDKQSILWYNIKVSLDRGIAQLVEQRTPNPCAEGSIPSAPAIAKCRRCVKISYLRLFYYPGFWNKFPDSESFFRILNLFSPKITRNHTELQGTESSVSGEKQRVAAKRPAAKITRSVTGNGCCKICSRNWLIF